MSEESSKTGEIARKTHWGTVTGDAAYARGMNAGARRMRAAIAAVLEAEAAPSRPERREDQAYLRGLEDGARQMREAIAAAFQREGRTSLTRFGEAALADRDGLVAALVTLTRAGIPTDVQELLLRGNPERGVAPGALLKALKAARAAADALADVPGTVLLGSGHVFDLENLGMGLDGEYDPDDADDVRTLSFTVVPVRDGKRDGHCDDWASYATRIPADAAIAVRQAALEHIRAEFEAGLAAGQRTDHVCRGIAGFSEADFMNAPKP